jgi:glycosyltransferase involved in cell wall biosynthesis
MRISIVAPLVTPLRDPQAGGAQAAVCELSRGLVLAGDEVELHAARGSRVRGVPLRLVRDSPFPDELLAFGPTQTRGQRHPSRSDSGDVPWPSLQADAFLRVAADIRRRGPDVAHAHAFDWPAFYALAASGVAVVHTLHLGPIAEPVVAAAVAASRCTPRPRFVTGSKACAADWRRHLGHISVIPFGIDGAKIPFRARPESDLAIIAGRISPEKGTHISLTAAKRAGLRSLLVGPVYDAAYHREQVVPRLVATGATWIGPVTRRRLARLFGRAAVALVASRWDEPFGLVALEANLAGTPVAGFARGGLPEVVGASGGVLTEDETVRGLVQAISAAIELDREAVRRSAARRHSLELMVDRYRRLYRSMSATA